MQAALHSRWSAIAAFSLVAPAAAFAHDGTCKNSTTPSEAAVAASKALKEDSGNLEARLKLADALLASNCFEDAVHVLEEGEATHGRNGQLQSQLREARSMMREQTYFEGLNRAEDAAKLSHNLHRCNKLADIEACDAADRPSARRSAGPAREGGRAGARQAASGSADDTAPGA